MTKLSDNFKSSLFIHLKTKPLNDFTLDSTTTISTFENPFALNGKILVESSKENLNLYRLLPLSKIDQVTSLDKIKEMIFIGNKFIYTTDESLNVDGGEIKGDYGDVSLKRVGNLLGLQYPTKLKFLNNPKEIKASTSFYSHGVLLTSYDFLLTIYIHLEKKMEINLPDVPVCLTTDLLFTRIYCGLENGDILCISLDGTPNRTLDYHKSKIVSLAFSFCQRFLYSADAYGVVCVWDVGHNVVTDKIEVGCEVYKVEVSLTGGEVVVPSIFQR